MKKDYNMKMYILSGIVLTAAAISVVFLAIHLANLKIEKTEKDKSSYYSSEETQDESPMNMAEIKQAIIASDVMFGEGEYGKDKKPAFGVLNSWQSKKWRVIVIFPTNKNIEEPSPQMIVLRRVDNKEVVFTNAFRVEDRQDKITNPLLPEDVKKEIMNNKYDKFKWGYVYDEK